MTAAIVLAGGRSTRFGADKLSAAIGGRSLLRRTLDAVAAAGCDPVAVVTARDLPLADGHVLVSELPRWSGPCAAVAAGIEALADGSVGGPVGTSGRDVVVLPADLADPALALDALRRLPAAGVLRDGDGRPQWLVARAPFDVLRARLRELGPELSGLSARALLGVLPVSDLAAPPLATSDIDRPRDLELVKETVHASV
jgi:molybdopterin-guanine dinucleotide biosynthesis protein A